MQKHIPVLMQEVLHFLAIKPNEVYLDVTFGGGGHTRAILESNNSCKVIGLDWDKSVIETVGKALQQQYPDRFFPVWGNFARVDQLLAKTDFSYVHGILADFGTSQMQIAHTPGLSLYQDSYLDMRMSAAHFKVTAYEVVNYFSQKELAHILFAYADERYGNKIAQAIVERRKKKHVSTTTELADLIQATVPQSNFRIHPATKTFQALRIFVNKELENIESFLKNTSSILYPEGRLVCISFHSLEDRLVKQFFKDKNKRNNAQQYFEVLTKSVCMAEEKELQENRSSRSARLRAAILKKTI